jgi:cytochrome c553
MVVLLSAACLSAAAAPAGGQEPAASPASSFVESGDAERGRAVVVGAAGAGAAGACFQCHGLDGKGDAAAVFPRLSGQSYAYLLKSLADYAAGRRQNAVMAPIAAALTDGQRRDVSAYYASLAEAEPGPRPDAGAHMLVKGGAIAAIGQAQRGVQGCVNCHGPAGSGLPPVYPKLAGQYATYLEAQLAAWRNGQRTGDTFGVMETIAKRLSDDEIKAVAAYYASIRPVRSTGNAGPISPLPSTGSLGRAP